MVLWDAVFWEAVFWGVVFWGVVFWGVVFWGARPVGEITPSAKALSTHQTGTPNKSVKRKRHIETSHRNAT